MDYSAQVTDILKNYGQNKVMGSSANSTKFPHYFLLRNFLGYIDLLSIFNTRRCQHQCFFCSLPAKSDNKDISVEDISQQFLYIIEEVKHSLEIIDRITLSNDGSVFDTKTFPKEALLNILYMVKPLRHISTLVFETRLEYFSVDLVSELQEIAGRKIKFNILTGFETKNAYIRDNILNKRETIDQFLRGLDNVALAKCDLTAYMLYKPSPLMTDDEAYEEAEETFNFLDRETSSRGIKLSVRVNPMYSATGSKWSELARNTPMYQPPKLTDVIKFVNRKVDLGLPIYIGLSSEGLNSGEGMYKAREDFSKEILKTVLNFNWGRTKSVKL